MSNHADCIIHDGYMTSYRKLANCVSFGSKIVRIFTLFSFLDALQMQVEEITRLIKTVSRGKHKEICKEDLIIDWSDALETTKQRQNVPRYGEASSSRNVPTYGEASSSRSVPEVPRFRPERSRSRS